MNTPSQLPLRLAFQPRHDFAHYHAGGNAEAVTHLYACVRGEGESFIFLHGESAQGKTHLLHACCAEAQARDLSVAYLPLTELADYGPDMLEGLETLDLVCLDDLDSVAGRADWECALFGLFNHLNEVGGRLLIAARQPPAELPVDLPDLKSRLGGGLTLWLRPLDEEDTLAALTLQARELGFELPAPVGRFLLAHCRRDLASLRRLLEQLDLATLAAQRRLTLPFLKTYLENKP